MKKGGNCSATDYGMFVWGQNPQPVPNNGNLIQAVGDPTQLKGGKKDKKGKGGKGIMTAAAVPALLISANHLYKRKKIKGGDGNQLSMQSMLEKQMSSLNDIQKLLPTPPSGTISANAVEPYYRGGKGIIETVAVPAIFLTANHLYRPRRKTNKRIKRSRRYSMKKR